MKRRDFFRHFLAAGLTFAAPCQVPNLLQSMEVISPATARLSIREELSIVETLTKACWQFLPHVANVVDSRHLNYIQDYRQMLEAWLKSSPGSSIDLRLTEAIGEITQVEATLLYAQKHLEGAEKSYLDAIQVAEAFRVAERQTAPGRQLLLDRARFSSTIGLQQEATARASTAPSLAALPPDPSAQSTPSESPAPRAMSTRKGKRARPRCGYGLARHRNGEQRGKATNAHAEDPLTSVEKADHQGDSTSQKGTDGPISSQDCHGICYDEARA